MKTETKEAWTSALRSGDYVQGKGALRVNNAYCCLGVLCDLAVKDGVKVNVETISVGQEGMVTKYDGLGGVLPKSVMEWAGLDSCDPSIQGRWLSVWNDDGETFDVISDLIEGYL